MSSEQFDHLLVLVAKILRAKFLGQVERTDHALRRDDRNAEEGAHVGMALRPPAAKARMLVDVTRPVSLPSLEHRAEHAVLAGQRAERGDQLVAHAGGEEAAEAAFSVRQSERREPRVGKLTRAVDETLQHLVDRKPRRHRKHGAADGLQRWADAIGHRS